MTASGYYTAEDFFRVPKIDGHIHMNTQLPHFCRVAADNNIVVLSINTEVPEYPPLQDQRKIVLEQQKTFPGRVHFLSSFNAESLFADKGLEKVLAYLGESFEQGAVGVKVWKNIGMDLRREDGSFVMINDEIFDPVFTFLAEEGIPVLGHIGEPRNCWLPIEEMTVNNDKIYYSGHPEFHMYKHPEYPSYENLIRSRDCLLEKFPNLVFIGAHLGSLEWDVDEVAKRLDRYPGFFVDLTDRICHLQYQADSKRKKVMEFLYAYQDRIIYGTDLEYFDYHSKQEIYQHSVETWKRDWAYFVTEETMQVPALERPVRGLGLEKDVIDKIFYRNAYRCYFEWGQNNK